MNLMHIILHHNFRHYNTSNSPFRRLGLLDIDSYFYNRFLRWTGHVARMPMSRAPRHFLASWVANYRQVGCPQMTWGRTLENALVSKGISKDFDEWFAIAKHRPKWRQQTHSKTKPLDAWWLKDTSRVNGYNCFMQKETQPSQDCSIVLKVTPFLLLYVTGHRGVSLYLGSIK